MKSPLLSLELCVQFSAAAAHFLWDCVFYTHGIALEYLSQDELDEIEAPSWWGKPPCGYEPPLDPNETF